MKVKTSTYIHISTVTVVFFILFSHTLLKLAQDWFTDDNFSHGFLIPFVTGFLIWQKRDQLTLEKLKYSNWGLLIISIGMLLHILGTAGAEMFIMRMAIVVTLTGLSFYFFGSKITISVIVPLAYLMFMIPIPAIIWNKIAFPLQLLAAKLSTLCIQFLDIPVLRQGNILQLPDTTLEVVDACSGLRSLTSLLSLSAAFAYMAPLKNFGKWLLFGSAIPIAIIVNIFRLTITAVFARYIGPETAHGLLHELSGVVIFITALILLYFFYLFLKRVGTLHI